MSADPTLGWSERSNFLMEAAILYAAAGQSAQAKQSYERLYTEAVRQGDYAKQWAGLNYLVNQAKRPQSKADLERTIQLFEALHVLLSKSPLSDDPTYQQYLADSYFEYGRTLRRAGQTITELGDQERRDLYEQSCRILEVFRDLGMFAHDSKANSLLELGESQARAGRTAEAITTFKSIVNLEENTTVAPSYALWKAIELEYPNRRDRIKPMEKVLSQLPQDKYSDAFKQQLVFEYLEAEMWDRAIALVSQILETPEGDEVNAYNMYLLSTALRRSGRFAEANAVLDDISRRFPETDIAKYLAQRERRIIQMEQEGLLKEQLDSTVAELARKRGDSVLATQPLSTGPSQNHQDQATTESAGGGDDHSRPSQGSASRQSGVELTVAVLAALIAAGFVFAWRARRRRQVR